MENLIVANWKMNPNSQKEAKEIFDSIREGVRGMNSEVVVCPPFVYISDLVRLSSEALCVGGQNMYFEEKGAFTGEISASMIKDLGVEYVIIGHSERRKYFGETDEIINKKIKVALTAGLKVIFCIGENLEEREAGKTESVLERQIKIGLLGINNFDNLNIAYEPVWAISNGDPYKTKELPTPKKVTEIFLYVRNLLDKICNQKTAEKIRTIYGGSANAENVKGYLKDSGVQGLLVGGASLNAEEFVKIVKSAEQP